MRAAFKSTACLLAGQIPTESIPAEPIERLIESDGEALVANTLDHGACLASFCLTCRG